MKFKKLRNLGPVVYFRHFFSGKLLIFFTSNPKVEFRLIFVFVV